MASFMAAHALLLPRTGFRNQIYTGDSVMSGKGDEIKGRVKEAAGALTGNEKLKREGKVDQAAGKTKEAVEKVIDKTKDAIQGK
jgi:uncharacterized protein YjbJ (UPF0337 family)